MTTLTRIAILGAGNMGGALLNGLLQHGYLPATLWASNPHQAKLAPLQAQGVQTTTDNITAIASANIVVLAVKPYKMRALAAQIASAVIANPPQLILSIAAGIRTHTLSQWLGGYDHIVCAMPNLASAIGYGAAGLYALPTVSRAMREAATTIMQAVGEVVWVDDETLLDTVTALSGAGPAYCFLMAEAMTDAAVKQGLPYDVAQKLSLQTMLGAARIAQVTNEPLAHLRKQVTSKGGATEQGLKVLQAHRFTEIIEHALLAAKTRAETISKESEE